MRHQYVPWAGTFPEHAHGGILGSLAAKLDDGLITRDEFEEAVNAFNQIVDGDKMAKIVTSQKGFTTTELVDRPFN